LYAIITGFMLIASHQTTTDLSPKSPKSINKHTVSSFRAHEC
jgi:hypothetical protein